MIETVNLTKQFGEVVAVKNLNLRIERGELFVFLGPNGAGKTTTIKMLTGLLKPTEGKIFVGGYDMAEHPSLAKSIIGYVSDAPYLYDKLTGREFLEFILRIYGKEIKESIIQEYLETFDLTEYGDRLIEDYSHGMKQKLALASALIHEPQILIIDEPMVGLDPRSARILKNILKEKSREGVTVFLSTHSLPVAQELADRIGIIHHGRLISLGTVETLRKEASVKGSLEEVFLQITEEKNATTSSTLEDKT